MQDANQLKLKNWHEVALAWERAATDPQLALIALRHAQKITGARVRAGLTLRGCSECVVYKEYIAEILRFLCKRRRSPYLVSANTERNTHTLRLLGFVDVFNEPIKTPPELDVPNCGPNDEDLETARALGKRLGIPTNEALDRFEEFGLTRVGELREVARKRIRLGLVNLVANDQKQLTIYCGNYPIMMQALGFQGEPMPELSVLFCGFDRSTSQFKLLERIDPEFTEME